MIVNDSARNVSIKKFKYIEQFDKWKNENPQYLIYSIEPIYNKNSNLELLVFYKIINPVQ